MNISVIGLGKLGAPLAAVMASKGHRVIGADINPAFVAALSRGQAPVDEPGLADLIARNAARLSATQDIAAAVLAADITFLVVPTPSDSQDIFSNDYVLAAAEHVGQALQNKNAYPLVCLTSTVMPGTCGGVLLPFLEKRSGRRAGASFGLCYNPAFIALGSVIHDFLNPDVLLIGESDPQAGNFLAALYAGVCESNPQLNRMNFVNAELAKISLNSFVTAKISFANMLAEICEKLPGADVDAVTRAVGADSRVGRKYFRGGVSFGGPCFPRDNKAFATMARSLGLTADMALATDAINGRQAARIAGLAAAKLPPNGTAAVLGLAYKSGTHVAEVSMGLDLARHLAGNGARVVVYDPFAAGDARRALPETVVFASSLREAAGQADVLVLPLSTEELRQLSPADLKAGPHRPVVIDCWRMLNAEVFRERADYIGVGTFLP
jgi:UDPglucose 6-dehydrogenase